MPTRRLVAAAAAAALGRGGKADRSGDRRLFAAEQVSPCGEHAEVWEREGWRLLEVCGGELSAHFGAYYHEALVMPVLCTVGAGARRALVLGGGDGGVATQLLKSTDMEQVVLVSDDLGLAEAARRHLSPISDSYTDPRLVADLRDPAAWLDHVGSEGGARYPGPFDLIFVLDALWHKEEVPADHRSFGPIRRLLRHLAPGGALVHQAGSIWSLHRVQSIFQELLLSFSSVAPLQFSSVEREPWHELAFVAGAPAIVEPDWAWCRRQQMRNIFYNEAMHFALLVPAATVSHALGLKVPRRPHLRDAHEREQRHDAQPPEKAVGSRFRLPPLQERQALRIHREYSRFQHIEVVQRDGFVSLYLDGELQLTTLYGDFYHEALVHPAMAALGARGRRVLIIGAGDGGVARVVLQYPVDYVVQLEIDERVVKVARRFLPGMAEVFDDPRLHLRVTDAIEWVTASGHVRGGHPDGGFDLCVIDTTDTPLASPWTLSFFQSLKAILSPHGAVVQNVGSMGDWLLDHHHKHQAVFKQVHTINTNSPDYPSPYFLALATDGLDPFAVDWGWWSGLHIRTMYYHPTLHAALFALPQETKDLYANLGGWRPYDANATAWQSEDAEL